MLWGLLGPEQLESRRRTRALGVGAAVRQFNGLAVPGMGGVWFGKQLMLALLGISLAENARTRGLKISNIETANAVEALACRMAFGQKWHSDPRLLGRQKLQGKTVLSFAHMRQRGFYVTQPMRMRTIEPLLALGLAEGTSERFNAMSVSEQGKSFTQAALKNFKPLNGSVANYLSRWIAGSIGNPNIEGALHEALTPVTPLPEDARGILRELIVSHGDGASRRKNALSWLGRDNSVSTWSIKPDEIAEDHWRDLRTGAKFFQVRDAAISLLDSIEGKMGEEQKFELARKCTDSINEALDDLRQHAQSFLDESYDPSPGGIARVFCRECTAEPKKVLTSIVQRDDRVLRCDDGFIVPGPAFQGKNSKTNDADEEDDSTPVDIKDSKWPEGISFRINNFFLMAKDLDGDLDNELQGDEND